MRVRIIRIELKCRASYQNPPTAQQFHAAYKGIRPCLTWPDDRCAAPDIE
ncbi:50S ribosomal protein L40 [Burkholderia cenocepacia]|nr:50S ribosomal protein L40 [Burkholderia cenocepacia]RQU64229.1 50S ribosomal protein L40 [Burkholderia cenocepacia]